MTPKDLQILAAEGVPQDYVLNSVYEIENIILLLKEINSKVDFYKDLKKFRTESINEKIDDYSKRSDQLRKLIQDTLKHFKEKTLDFPGIGKVTRRNKSKDTWQIVDEDSLRKFFEEKGVKDQVYTTKEVIDKREAMKMVDAYVKQGVNVPGLFSVEGSESVSISFSKNKEKEEPVSHVSLDELEELNI